MTKLWHALAIRICLMMSLLFCIYLTTRRAVGAWYFRRGSPDEIQRAIKWDPANPEYYDALGTLMHLYSDGGNSNEIIQLYRRATRLGSHEAQFWADLGGAYERAGHSNEGLDAFQNARQLFPNSPEINWRLANFYVRAGKIPEALHSLRMVLSRDGTAGRRAFVLATNATRDREAILEMLPPQAPVFFDYLNFRIEKGDIVGAEEVWAHILQLNLAFDLRQTFPYLDALVQHRELQKLSDTWCALAERFPAQVQHFVPGSNRVTNGNFEANILNGGLDWRIVPAEGVVVSLDSVGAFEGTRALRIAFDGSRNIDYGHVFQYVPVDPNRRYRFSGFMRAQGITTDSGLRFQLCDAYNVGNILVSTENLVGTSGWLEQHAEFTTPSNIRLLLVRVVRRMSTKFESQIAGTLWIDDVRLISE